ncbi:MAG: helix-turn-helix domain-containing protein [Acidimicrobiales bacterium]
MALPPGRVSTGAGDIDDLLHGLIPGDNVVWVPDDASVMARLEEDFLAASGRAGLTRAYVTTATRPDVVKERVGAGVVVLDARPRQAHADAAVLEQTLMALCATPSPACVVLDGLHTLARRWRPDRALAFFSRVCPRMFDAGAIAYWRAPRRELGNAFVDQVEKVTQCVLEIRRGGLRVVKAEGRTAAIQGMQFALTLDDTGIHLDNERVLGRLARGLEHIRRERNLTQGDLARIAGVSSSAISQAEAGRSGLSLETLVALSEGLGVSIDALLGGVRGPGYVLARRDRSRTASSYAALLDDPEPGLRAYLVGLGAGEAGVPPVAHKGAEMALVASGLVQLQVADDTPVMRAGDALLAASATIGGWRNLTLEPARLFWVIRD